MADPFLGEIRIVPFNFPPIGWASCDGQTLAISQNTALFSLLGVAYGGDGVSTFMLPNMQGSVPMDYGSGTSLTGRGIGATGGTAAVTLLAANLPPHAHTLNGDSGAALTTNPSGAVPAVPSAGPHRANQLYSSAAPTTPMLANCVLPFGGGLAHNNMQPYLTLNFIIALQGIYPARN